MKTYMIQVPETTTKENLVTYEVRAENFKEALEIINSERAHCLRTTHISTVTDRGKPGDISEDYARELLGVKT